jgi:hypothetical protein
VADAQAHEKAKAGLEEILAAIPANEKKISMAHIEAILENPLYLDQFQDRSAYPPLSTLTSAGSNSCSYTEVHQTIRTCSAHESLQGVWNAAHSGRIRAQVDQARQFFALAAAIRLSR